MSRQAIAFGVGGRVPVYVNQGVTRQDISGTIYVNELSTSLAPYTLTASAGSFSITGISAGIAVARKLTASAGAFSITGISAVLNYSGAPPRSGGGRAGMGFGGGFGGLGVRRSPFSGSSTSSTRFLILGYGQSGMNGLFTTSSSPPAASAGTYYYNGSSLTTVPSANGVREMMNELRSATGKDCVCFNGSVIGVDIVQLTKGYGLGYYESLLAQVQAVKQAGDVPIIIWDQGEGDTNSTPPTEPNVYKTYLERIRSDFSSDLSVIGIPLFIGGIGHTYGHSAGTEDAGTTDFSWQLIRNANFEAGQWLGHQTLKYSHSNILNTHTDGYHYDGNGQARQGKAFAQSIKAYLGISSAYPHWEVASAATIDATTTDVSVVHGMGTDFTPTSGITAFEASGDNGKTWVSCTGARTSATVIRLTHDSITTSNLRLIRYQYGQGWGQTNAPTESDQSNTVRDNSSLNNPLTPTTWNIRPTALSTTPALTHRYRTLLTGLTTGASVSDLPLGPESVRKMVVIGMIGNIVQYFTGGTLTPNIGSAASLTLVKAQNNNVGIYQAVLGSDAASATTFRLDITTSQSLGGGFVRNVITVDTVPYSDLNSTTATVGGTSASSNTVASSTVNASAGGLIFALAASSNISTNSGAFTGDESFAQRNNNGSLKCTQKADASNVSANASSGVTITYANSGNIDLALASWR